MSRAIKSHKPAKEKRDDRKKRPHEPKAHKKFTRKPDAAAPAEDKRTHVVGVVTKTKFGWTILSADRKDKGTYIVRVAAKAEQDEGQLVVAEIQTSSRLGRREVTIQKRLGSPDDKSNVSLIAINTHGIPVDFSKPALDQANAAKPVDLGQRTDLRAIPLVTIDGIDARDFDDAVFAEPDPKTGGWHLIVAIADVSHYVPASSPLDLDAYERGNSVYFPDRVVPMLPEALCNDLCSLRPQVDRACMAVHLYLNKGGELTHWKFVRGLMRSVARLTYEQVQAAHDGNPDKTTSALIDTVIKPLYGAYDALAKARVKRGTLELDIPERKIELNTDGTIKLVKLRERFESHKLIEEFMIAANVAAASDLDQKGCLYRIHDKPNEIKLTALREFLDGLSISLVPAKQLHPRFLTQILTNVAGKPEAALVNEVMLRSQSQAVYDPDNIGHFGLALGKYAHFTSPIRRYADLVIHRALIRANKLGDDGATEEHKRLVDIGAHLSITERRAAAAEREVVDRFTTLYLADHVGATFSAHISGVAKFGLFVKLDENGAEGIVLFNSLPGDYYNLDEKRQALVGQRTNKIYQLTQPVMVKLEKADRLTGSLGFAIIDPEKKEQKSEKRVAPPKRFKKTRHS